MTGLSFLSPALLYGLAFAAIPIIIHLLFRRRFIRVDWAPFEYLKLSLKRNRRRIRLEQLVLLAIRVLAMLLLFFLVARPVVQAHGLAGWLGGRSRTSQLLVIDNSLSMGFQDGGRSAFERAKDLAGEILKTIGPQDRLTLVLSAAPQAPVLREVEVAKREELAEHIEKLELSETFTPWSATLKTVDELIESSTYPIREVTLITDLRRAGWDTTVAELGNRWAGQRVRLRIFDVGCERTDNLALVDLEQMSRVALMGAATRWQAVVQNTGASAIDGLDATFTVDGKPGLVRLPEIAAGSTARIPLAATFQEAGPHHVSFSLPGDDLRGDDQRWSVTDVREHLHMVLVDGEPSGEALGGEVDFLGLALSVGVGEGDAWQVEVVTDTEWASRPLGRPDLLVLANVPTLTAERAAELTRLVRSGAGLMIFLGDQVDPDNYNRMLFDDGAGPLPARLEAPVEGDVNGLVLEDVERSPLEAVKQLDPAVLERIRVHKLMNVQLPAEVTADHGSATHVLARWNNAASSPAVLLKELGAGRVLLWTVTADKAWSDWPTDPTYVLAVCEAAQATVRAESAGRALTAGDKLRRLLAPGQQVTSPVVESPGAEAPQPLQIAQESAAESGLTEPLRSLVFSDTSRAGLYRLTWGDAQGNSQHDEFAVNPDRRESELARIPADELSRLFGSFEVKVIPAASADTPITIRGQEIWRTLAAALLCLLVVESCFATWVGRQR